MQVSASTERTNADDANPPDERLPLRPGKFYLEAYGPTLIDGWTGGELWNGWATPLFEYSEALQLVDLQNALEPIDPSDRGRAWYDEARDRICFIVEGSGQQVEEYPPVEREAGGQVRKLYPVGAWYWTWEESEV